MVPLHQRHRLRRPNLLSQCPQIDQAINESELGLALLDLAFKEVRRDVVIPLAIGVAVIQVFDHVYCHVHRFWEVGERDLNGCLEELALDLDHW